MDTLGTSVLSIVQTVVSSSEVEMYGQYRQGVNSLSIVAREVVHSSECPLSEVPLYLFTRRYTSACACILVLICPITMCVCLLMM